MFTADSLNEIEPLKEVIERKVKAQLPAEKAAARHNQTLIAQQLEREGSRYIPGVGQKIGTIDARTYFRLEAENPGCMRDQGFLDQLLRDSPKLRSPGYRPPTHRRPTYTIIYK